MISLYSLFEYKEYNPHHFRINLQPGMMVQVVKKKDQRTGILTAGEIDRVLSPGDRHTRGIKVKLKDGTVGRVQKIDS